MPEPTQATDVVDIDDYGVLRLCRHCRVQESSSPVV